MIGNFLFGTEIGWEQLKNHPVELQLDHRMEPDDDSGIEIVDAKL